MSKITKKQLNEYISLSNKVDIDLMEENKNSYKIMINGDKAKVSKSSFQEIVLDFIKEQREFNNKQIEFNENQKEFNKKMEKRLESLESDVKLLKSFHKNEM